MFDLLYDRIRATVPIDDGDFEYFKSLLLPKKLRRRQYLLQEGNICRYQAFVSKGILRCYKVEEKGSETILQFAPEGWWVADLASYLNQEPSNLTIDALEDAELLLLEKSPWEQAMKEIPALERYFRIITQNHLITTQKRLLQSLAETAEEKYKRFLSTYPDCAQRVPKHMIASFLGLSRETLSRIRN